MMMKKEIQRGQSRHFLTGTPPQLRRFAPLARGDFQESSQRGFTLIEMMIATLVLVTGLVSVASLIGYSISSNSSSKNDTVAVTAAELALEQLRSLSVTSLADGGSVLSSTGKISFASSPVAGYSTSISLADSDQIGKTVNYDVRWNITTINGMKKITVAAQRSANNSRFLQTPAQLVLLKAP